MTAMTQMKILYVEDDDLLRMVTSIALEEEGYLVVQAVDGRDAQSKLKKGHFDCVVSDITMPGGISGIDVAHTAQDIYPAVKIVLVSGVSQRQLPPIPASVQYLAKPFRVAELIRSLSAP